MRDEMRLEEEDAGCRVARAAANVLIAMSSTKYTRLIVKNLPEGATEPKLRDLFASKGTVTDVQLKRFNDGKSRHFAFVGYRTEEEASAARDYFDKSFFGGGKMQVEPCYPLNDPNKPKAWSKHSKKAEEPQPTKKKKKKEKDESDDDDANANATAANATAAAADDDDETAPKKIKRREEELYEKAQADPDFLEFLQVHNSKSQAKWGNDTVLDTLEKMVLTSGKKKDKEEIVDKKKSEGKPKTKKEEVKKAKGVIPEDTFFTVKLRNLPKKAKKKDLKAFFAPLVPKSIRTPPGLRGFAYVGFLTENERRKALAKNRSILLGQQITVRTYVSRAGVVGAEMGERKGRWAGQAAELERSAEGVEESGRIFVRNLAYTVNEADLKMEFEKFGPVTEVHLPVDRLTRQSKGFAFVSFLLPEQAAKAFEALDGTTFQGRMLHLLPSKSKDDDEAGGGGVGGSSYKREKEASRKKTAGSSHNWNSLFLGMNAVSAVVSEKYGVSREQLLLDNSDAKDEHSSSVAVRMALAETEIVSATQKFLEANGVCLDAFDASLGLKLERSTTTFLVKNLVANTTEDELRLLFEKSGVLGRVVLPPSGVTAIVEFMVPSEARGAFKKLAYSRFKGMPLYLEWAPVNVFRVASDGSKISVRREEVVEEKTQPTADKKTTKLAERELPNYDDDDEPFDENMVPEPETTVFVKNLNFSTGETELKKHFASVGRIFAVTVARRKDPKSPDQLLSQGFGFVQFYRAKDAAKALTTLNQSMLQNHSLEIKMSSRTLQSENAAANAKTTDRKCSKILVRNVPFQANEAEITDLFKVFGKLKAVRMPRKATGESQHRGFAFIDFFVEANAKTAFDTLSKSTHVYGRRLVLEWAEGDASLEELRNKVARQQATSSSSSHHKDNSTKKQLRRYFEKEEGTKSGRGDEEKGDDD
ncbi:probable RNA-binding protein 19 isoform X2 [Folsomia candida]|uniref:probable RNA-binding protein 19 isoform X2 n=1 Tax=Folsomia candida TaxID=158441 RepID=UPI001604C40B|nr:probable RNA-binding protein 19 isoform X2 [Folsomia candida]